MKNIKSSNIKSSKLNSSMFSIDSNKNEKINRSSYFEVFNKIKKEYKEEQLKKKNKINYNLVDNLYLKNTKEYNNYLTEKKDGNLSIKTKKFFEQKKNIINSDKIKKIKDNQNNWNTRIPGLKYRNPIKNRNVNLTPLIEKNRKRLNSMEKKEFYSAERKGVCIRILEYTHAYSKDKITNKKKKNDKKNNIKTIKNVFNDNNNKYKINNNNDN